MKKKILLLASAVICLAILATGTLAYFTSSKTAHNVITSGGITIEIEEKTTGGVDFPKEGISERFGVLVVGLGLDSVRLVTVQPVVLPLASVWVTMVYSLGS